ncbi:hypothetical protein T4B_10890 [Trichinella pseudospiralis]|uniref:Uncharacterized protein n=2 Tax=Trichinella pseudospiralis TaxID=6337 RepID=A0A0V1IPW6_TRIPS|nr:hypothetical protein T4A_1895 [Trichinella pseudospiralis]KRY86114.1 hypothetical protein T4D_8537 [Trichinella pseudospiralis]KRZ24737.1 hypothetical protein T4B_10890 [Trichinella pseudospiralis]KRZ30417.1 hypothetical protein T4C_2703 [Trichinella pseudospiralis]
MGGDMEMMRKNQSAQDSADLQSLTARVDRQRPLPRTIYLSWSTMVPFTDKHCKFSVVKVTLMRLTGGFTRPEPQRNVHLLAFSFYMLYTWSL